jgi:hypothetical protein
MSHRRGLSPIIRTAVFERACGRCEACGNPLDDFWECHHRRFKSQGGLNERTNLVALCQMCHIRAHSDRSWGESRGLVVPSWKQWARVPVTLWDTRMVFLTGTGYDVLPEVAA